MIFSPQADDRKVRVFSLSQTFLDGYKGRQPNWGPVGYFTYKRTYSRDLPDGTTEEFWQTCKRVVEGTFNIQKIHCKQMGLPWNEQKAQASAQDMFQRMWAFKFTPPGRGLWMMGTDLVYERGSAALQNCFAGGERFLTKEHGVVSFAEVEGETLHTLDDVGQWQESRVSCFGSQNLQLVTFAPANPTPRGSGFRAARSNHRVTIKVTPNHRWILADGIETTQLHVGDTVPSSFYRPGTETEAYQRGLVHGLIFGDGAAGYTYLNQDRVFHIRLCGEKNRAFTHLFQHVTYPPSYSGDPWCWVRSPENLKAFPDSQKDPDYLAGFLQGWVWADASTSKAEDTMLLCSQHPGAEKWLETNAALAGFLLVGNNLDPTEETPYGPRSAPMRRFTLSRRPALFWKVTTIEELPEPEPVYCATVPGKSAFTLASGVYTGNCAFVSTENISEDFAAPFCFLMDMSMLGVGVGGDTRGSGKAKIQAPKFTQEPFIVQDSREGWVELVRTILNSFVGKGSFPRTIIYSKVRGRGAPIRTFGGIASGPKPLHLLVENITRLLMPRGSSCEWTVDAEPDMASIRLAVLNTIIPEDVSYRISSSQIVDIFNFVGKAVVAGGVRRSSEIMFGDADDQDFVTLKQDLEALSDRRWASNNSVFGTVGMDYTSLVDSMAKNGEPGIFWIDAARNFSRMGHPADNKDYRVMGTNPCVTGDTITWTAEGPRRVDRMLGSSFQVPLNGEGFNCSTGFFQTGVKPVYLLKTKEGHQLKLTDDHLVQVATRVTRKKLYLQDISAGDLESGDQLILNNRTAQASWSGMGTFDQGWLLGSMLGDGYIHQDGFAVVQYWGPQACELLTTAQRRIETLGGDPRYHKTRTGTTHPDESQSTSSIQLAHVAHEFGIRADKVIEGDNLVLASSDFQRGFLRGLFDADGAVVGSHEKGCSVRLSSSTLQHLHIAQKMLLNLGINSTIYQNRRDEGIRMLPDGKGGLAPYPCQAQHELVISNENIRVYFDRVSFEEDAKRRALVDILVNYKRTMNRERFLATFESLTYLGVEPVFDCTVDEVHHFDANGFVVHNCGEQSLESFELCNLVETYPAHHDSYEDFERTLKMAYLYAKTVTLVPTHDLRANAVMMRNRRIGCSMSGIVQAMAKFGRREFLRWCDRGYNYVQHLDRVYCDWLCVPQSIKTTTVKPSGTVSLLCGATPGIHYPHSEYYIRRIRVQGTSPLIQACIDAGYEVEKDSYADDTMVVSFPVHEKHILKGKADVTVWEQFANAAALQEHWTDNQVSITVTFKKTEVQDLKACLELFEDKLKAIAVLPSGDGDHGYVQAPYEAITQEVYEAMVAKIKPLDFSTTPTHEVDEMYCTNDTCIIPQR